MKNRTIALWALWTLGIGLALQALNGFESTTDDTIIGLLYLTGVIFSVIGAFRLLKL